MIRFPSTAYVGRILPKEAFYRQLNLTPQLKEKFVSDIQRIRVEYSLTPATVHVDPCEEIPEILVLGVQLKKQEYDARVIEAIARQNPHKLLFLLSYEDRVQCAVYHGKLYMTDWQSAADATLSLNGGTLAAVWNGLIEQIALTDKTETAPEQSIEDRLKKQEEIAKLNREIEKLERLTRKETQPKIKFELYQKLQAKKKLLEEFLNSEL